MTTEEIKKLADDAYEGCHGCTESEEKFWKDGFVRGFIQAELRYNENQKDESNS